MRISALKKTAVLLAALMLTACAQTPKNVKERNDELNSMRGVQSSQADDMSGDELTESGGKKEQESDFGDLDYIRAHLKEDASKKYGRLTVKRAGAGDSKSMPTYKIEIGADSAYDIDKTAKWLFGDESASGIKKQIHGRGEPAPLISNPYENADADYDIKRIYPHDEPIYDHTFIELGQGVQYRCVSLTGDGHMSGGQACQSDFEQYYYAIHQGKAKMKERYYPLTDDISDKVYKMLDGQEWSLREAVRYAEDFANQELAPCDRVRFTHKVRSVGVSQLDDRHGFYFEMVLVDENGRVFDSADFAYDKLQADRIYGEKSFVIPVQYSIECLAKKQITRYFKSCSFSSMQKTADNEKLLTLGGAMNKLNSELAKNLDLSFESADLCYALVCQRYPKKEQGELVGYDESYCVKTCELSARPYWCFKEKTAENDFLSGAHRAFYVDAVTGEVLALFPDIIE